MKLFSISKSETVYFKGIAILLVLLGHFGFVIRGGAFGVNIFMILSGYGCMESLDSKGLDNYWKRKSGIYLTYLPFILFQIVFMWIVDAREVLQKLSASVVSLLGLDLDRNVDPTMWYISFIYLYLLLFWLAAVVAKPLKNKKHRHIVIILLMLSVSAVIYYISRDYHFLFHQSSSAFEYTFSFVGGIILSVAGKYELKKWLVYLLYVPALIASAVVFVMFYGINGGKYIMIYDFVGAVLFILLAGLHVCPLERVIGFLGRSSYEIYLTEGFFLREGIRWSAFLPYSWQRGVLAIAASILIGWGSHKLAVRNIVKRCKR